MDIIVKDVEITWKFNSKQGKEEEIFSFFENLEKEKRTFSKMELEFEDNVILSDINSVFERGDGEGVVKTQILTLNPK